MSFTVTTILPTTLELPNANDITNIVNKANLTKNKKTEPSMAELKEKELARTVYIINCVNYIFEYIKQTAPTKIFARVKSELNNCYVYRFSPPAARGINTRYFSQVVYDTETQECRFEYFRPLRHGRNLWYFPIYYMMNGYTKNDQRTFQELSINTVEQLLIDYFINKNYRIKFFRNRIVDGNPTGNLVYVEWDKQEPQKIEMKKLSPIKVIESIKVIDPIKVIEPIKITESIKVIEPEKKMIFPVSYNLGKKTTPWLKVIVNKTIKAE